MGNCDKWNGPSTLQDFLLGIVVCILSSFLWIKEKVWPDPDDEDDGGHW